MERIKILLPMVLTFITFITYSQSRDDQELISDAEKAKMELQRVDKGLNTFFDGAFGYVIFPNVGEGALIVGGASGKGAVYEKGILVGMADLKKVDVGLQAGGQAVTQIIFFKTEKAFQEFKQGDLNFPPKQVR